MRKPKKIKPNDIEIEILPTGQIRFSRKNEEYNKDILFILQNIIKGDKALLSDLNDFFNESKDIQILIGDRGFCG